MNIIEWFEKNCGRTFAPLTGAMLCDNRIVKVPRKRLRLGDIEKIARDGLSLHITSDNQHTAYVC